jgi:hypothetical protein
MVFEEILYVFLYHPGQFFDCKGDHIQETCVTNTVDVEKARDSGFDLGGQKFSNPSRSRRDLRARNDPIRVPKPWRRTS